MTLLEVDLSFLFVVAVILIWFMIAYQFVLTVLRLSQLREVAEGEAGSRRDDVRLPRCTILIPAHNEEKVIDAHHRRRCCSLDYPAGQAEDPGHQ